MLIYIRLIFGVFLLLASLSCNSVTPEKSKDLKVLMQLLDVDSMPEQMADIMVTQVINQERAKTPNVSKKVEEVISSVIRNVVLEHSPKLFEMVEPIYDKYYTHSEIKELINFFESPIGRKYNAVLQPMMQDIIPIGQKWGQDIGPIAAKELEKELRKFGYK